MRVHASSGPCGSIPARRTRNSAQCGRKREGWLRPRGYLSGVQLWTVSCYSGWLHSPQRIGVTL